MLHPKLLRFALFFVLFSATLANAQDLNRLRDRASGLWDLRMKHDKLDALSFIDQDTKQNFMNTQETTLLNYKLAGFEFIPGDSNHINVLVKVHFVLDKVGEWDKTVKETWVWKNGQWLMRADKSPSFGEVMSFAGADDKPQAYKRIPLEFQVAAPLIDIGRHTQGDLVQGKLPFQGKRGEIIAVRALQSITGLIIDSAVWTSQTEGYLPYQWDTTLLSQDVDVPLTLEARSNEDKAAANIRVRAKIDGKVAFKQSPEILEFNQGGKAEIRIQNLTNKTLKVLTARSFNDAFTISDVPPTIEPGKTGVMQIDYSVSGNVNPVAAVGIEFAEPIGHSLMTMIPLKLKTPETKQGLSREDLDRLVKPYQKPVLPTK